MKPHIFPILLFTIVSCIGFTSCDKFLDENPQGSLTEEQAFATESQLYTNAVASLYNHVGGNAENEGLQGTARGVYDLNTFCTDEAMIPTRGVDWYDGGLWQALFLHDFAKVDFVGDTWKYLYKSILLCNQSLEHIDAFETSHGATDNTRAWRAEVRALRAVFYYYAMDLFGRLPIFDSSAPTTDEMRLKSRSQVFDFIVNELQSVADNLEDTYSNHEGPYYGRITRPVVWFVLAKLALNAEVYTDDDWTDYARTDGKQIMWNIDGTKMNTWRACVHYCDLIANAGYHLEGDFCDNFTVHNETSFENIFTIPMNKYRYTNIFVNMFRSRHYNHAAALGLNGENGPCATLEAMEIFGYNTDDQDPRFYYTYYAGNVFDYSGNIITLDDGTPLVYEPMKVKLVLSGDAYEKTAGARMAKYDVDPTANADGKLSENDIVLFRFADVLLMKAEALVRNGEDGTEPFAMVRARATAQERSCTLDNILNERLLELAWEGWRRQDRIRFGVFHKAYAFRPQLATEANAPTTIVFPIPGDFLTLSANTQNPGY